MNEINLEKKQHDHYKKLSDISENDISSIKNEKEIENKSSYQFKALFLKNASLQSKQIGTNICQVFIILNCISQKKKKNKKK